MARSAGGSAVIFAILLLVTGFAAGSPPQADDSVTKIAKYFADHRGVMLVSLLLQLIAVPLAIWFFAVVRQAVAGDPVDNALGLAAVAGIVLAGAMALAGNAVGAAIIYVKDATFIGDIIRFMYELQTLLFISTAAGILTASGATAWAAHRTKRLPAVAVWLGLLAVVGNLVAMFASLGASAAMIGFAGFLTFALFMLVTGAAMFLSASKPAAG